MIACDNPEACACDDCSRRREVAGLERQLLAIHALHVAALDNVAQARSLRQLGKSLAGLGADVPPTASAADEQAERQRLEELVRQRESIRRRICALCPECPTCQGDDEPRRFDVFHRTIGGKSFWYSTDAPARLYQEL